MKKVGRVSLRIAVLLALSPALMAIAHSFVVPRPANTVITHISCNCKSVDERIRLGDSIGTARNVLGANGYQIQPLQGWPITIGDLPATNRRAADAVITIAITSRPSHTTKSSLASSPSDVAKLPPASFVVPLDTKLTWMEWVVNGCGDRIAIAFYSDRSGGSLTSPTVAMKKFRASSGVAR